MHYVWEKVPGETFVILGDEAEASRAISAATAAGLGAVAAGDVGIHEMNTLAGTFAESRTKARVPEMTHMDYETWVTIQSGAHNYNELLQKETTEKAAGGLITLDQYQQQMASLNGMSDFILLNSTGLHAYIDDGKVVVDPTEFHAPMLENPAPGLHRRIVERAKSLGATHYNPWEEIVTQAGRPQVATPRDAVNMQIGTLNDEGVLVPLITVKDNLIIPNP